MNNRKNKLADIRTKKSIKKIIFLTILSTLGIEIIFIGVGFFLFYTNYEKISVSASGESNKINFEYKDIEKQTSKNKKITYKKNDTLYKGSLGELKYVKKVIAKDENDKKIFFKLNETYIKKILFLNTLKEQKLVDKNIFNFFLNLNDKERNFNIESESFLKFLVLLDKIDEKKAKEIILTYERKFDKIKKVLKNYKINGQYNILANKLKNTETNLNNQISNNINEVPDKIYDNNGFFENDNVIFVISKLYDEKYYKNINKVASIYNIDEKKIISSVAVEQLRYLSTRRGYAKYLLQNTGYLTSFSKFSYGLGGVKVETAREIQASVKKYNLDIYNKYFLQDSLKSDEELIEVLKSDFGGILYTGGLLFSIENRWKIAGFDISNKPGVVTTLYNMGNPNDKIPNPEPKVGGSIIAINGKDMYFGEIGFLYYYYINYYIA